MHGEDRLQLPACKSTNPPNSKAGFEHEHEHEKNEERRVWHAQKSQLQNVGKDAAATNATYRTKTTNILPCLS